MASEIADAPNGGSAGVLRGLTYAVWTICLVLLGVASAVAHPLGNFTINHLARIETSGRTLYVHYVLDIAEIPTFQIMHAAGDWTPARVRAWQREEGALVAGSLSLTSDGVAVPLRLQRTSARLRAGAGGLPILYWTGDYVAAIPAKAAMSLRDFVYADRRIGWKDIVLPGLTDPTDELRSYPNALIGSPRQNDAASFNVSGGRITHARVSGEYESGWGATSIVRASALSDLLARDGQTPLWIALTILAAFGLGALHALEPGHGKALLAFTLVGARATFRQAAILAAALTVAHTSAVILLGLLLCFAAGFASETVFVWITLVSGVAVAVIGARSLSSAIARANHERAHERAHARGEEHDHHHHAGEHGHSHAIPGSRPLQFRSAVVAAMSGGIAPCPAAIVVLLTALHLHRVGYGVFLIVVFSLGLAAVLTGLGLMVVRGAGWLGRQNGFARVAHVAPFVTASIIAIIGSVMLAQGLIAAGLHVTEPAAVAAVLLFVALIACCSVLLAMRTAHRTLVIKETT